MAPGQQACPVPPHASQKFVVLLQFALPKHAPPEQQRSPTFPQLTQLPPKHTSIVVAHRIPGQHGPLCAPHDSHVPDEHKSPPVHWVIALQHGWPIAPHGTHIPLWHTLPSAQA
jgi:hypothetical protein